MFCLQKLRNWFFYFYEEQLNLRNSFKRYKNAVWFLKNLFLAIDLTIFVDCTVDHLFYLCFRIFIF